MRIPRKPFLVLVVPLAAALCLLGYCELQARSAIRAWAGSWVDRFNPNAPIVEIDAAGNAMFRLPAADGGAKLPMIITSITEEALEFTVERPDLVRQPPEQYVLYRMGRSAGLGKIHPHSMAVLDRGGEE